MADGSVQLPPDSSGTKLRVYGPLGDGSYVEGVALADANGDQYPESPLWSHLTSIALAAGASVSLDSPDVTTGKTGRLVLVRASASVPLKLEIRPVVAGTPGGIIDTLFSSDANLVARWTPPHPNFIRLAGATNSKWRATITNQDNIDAADVYVTHYWDEVS
jgi:hypothetical protein